MLRRQRGPEYRDAIVASSHLGSTCKRAVAPGDEQRPQGSRKTWCVRGAPGFAVRLVPGDESVHVVQDRMDVLR